MSNLLVRLPNEIVADPEAKTFKRFHYIPEESLEYFYQVFTTR